MGFDLVQLQRNRARKRGEAGTEFRIRHLEKPGFGREKSFWSRAVRQDFHPALDTPGIQNAPDFNGVAWQA